MHSWIHDKMSWINHFRTSKNSGKHQLGLITRHLEPRFFKWRLWNVQERSLSLRKYFKYFNSDEMLMLVAFYGSFGTPTKKIVLWVICRVGVLQLLDRPFFCPVLRGLYCLRTVNCVRNTAWRRRKQT